MPCQKQQCEQYVPIPEHPEGKHVCIDVLDKMLHHDANIINNAAFKDGERVLKLARGLARTQLTGVISEELLTIAQISKKDVKRLGN